jgi:hypothetical protein
MKEIIALNVWKFAPKCSVVEFAGYDVFGHRKKLPKNRAS